jgi:hypothetical protein
MLADRKDFRFHSFKIVIPRAILSLIFTTADVIKPILPLLKRIIFYILFLLKTSFGEL